MPKITHILLVLIIACCKIVAVAAPCVYSATADAVIWQDENANAEDNELEKTKNEVQEEYWSTSINLAHHPALIIEFASFSNNKLPEVLRQPVSPPPDVA